jgi:zinc transport system ATP-binding protein
MEAAIELQDVSFSYGAVVVLEHIDLLVSPGAFLGLVGPNGGGKSTLLKIVLGLLEPARGRARVLGKSPREARALIGYVPQFASHVRDFPISVSEAVLLGRLGRTRRIGGYRHRDREIAQRVMGEAEILDVAARPVSTLSGGQLQRVLIARALACEPSILLLDEPTANIDQRVEKDIFDLLRQLNARMTILVVSHDIGFVSQYVTQVACLSRTLMCHPTSSLSGEMIEALYESPVRMIRHAHGPHSASGRSG